MSRTLLPLAIPVLLLVAPARAQPQPTSGRNAEEIVADYKSAMKAYREAKVLAKDESAKQALMKEKWPDGKTWVLAVRAALDAAPDARPAASVLAWLFHHESDKDARRRIWERLCQEHLDSEAMADVCTSIQYGYPGSEPVLRGLVEKSPHRAVRGQACYSLAQEIRRAGSLSRDDPTPETAERMTGVLERVVREFADLPHFFRGSLGNAAECDLFELRHLLVGKVAPDIEGKDLDGVPFKLSDYRGKVVVVDFWGHW